MPQENKPNGGEKPYSISWLGFIMGFGIGFILFSIIGFFRLGLFELIPALLWLFYFSRLLHKEMKGKGDPLTIGFYIGCLGLIIGLIGYFAWKPGESVARSKDAK